MISSIAPARTILATISPVIAVMLAAAPALAAGSNIPWEQPLQQILQSIEGPVSKIVAVIIIIVRTALRITSLSPKSYRSPMRASISSPAKPF
jgi:type IV secretory pathway VirB2 component (pilin)